MSSCSGGSRKATAMRHEQPDVEAGSAAGSGSAQLMKMASSTLARMPKKASALTSQVVPNSRLKLTRLRVSSSRNAMPSTKKCGLNRRMLVPVTRAAREPRRCSAPSEDDGQRHEVVVGARSRVRRYRNGQSSVAGLGVGLARRRDRVDRVARRRRAVERRRPADRPPAPPSRGRTLRDQRRRRRTRPRACRRACSTSHGSR